MGTHSHILHNLTPMIAQTFKHSHAHSHSHTLNSFISEEQIDDPPQGDIDQEAIDLLS